jgi:uncharacterized protein
VVFSWRRFREHVTHVLHLDEEPSRLAMGMAVGVFIGLTPLYGLHTLLALVVAWVFRLNKAATITGAWLNLPWFAPFIYAFCLKLGEAILSGGVDFSWSKMIDLAEGTAAYLKSSPSQHVEDLWQMLWDMMFTASRPLFVGTTLVGLVLAVVTYFLVLEAVLEVRRLGHHKAAPKHPDGARSSEEPQP